jgi:glutaredoxin
MAETKIKDSLKKLLISELTEKKEEERLERVKENANLKQVDFYYDKRQKHTENFKQYLEGEGIKVNSIEVSENPKEWSYVRTLTNLSTLPTILVNKNALVMRRDFSNQKQLVNAVKHFANPNFKNPDFNGLMLEQTKTNSFNIMMRLNQLEQKINPIISFVNDLKKQLEEEAKEDNA